MSLVLKVREIDQPQAWNQLVQDLPIQSVLQSWGWGEVKRAAGWQPLRLVLERGSQPVAATQLLLRSFLGPLAMAYAPRGPALADLSDFPEVAAALARYVKRGIYLKFEPEVGFPIPDELPQFPGLNLEAPIQPGYSIWVDLAGEEAVLAAMKSKTRYNTRLSQRKGVIASREESFPEFYALFEETNERAKLNQHPRRYYQTVLEKMNQPGGQAFVSLARLEGVPLAAGMFVTFGGKLVYLYGGSTRDHKDVMAPYAMHWAAMQEGIALGLKTYDLWGVPKDPEGSMAAGIDRFKEGYGGVRLAFPAYDYPRSPVYQPLKRALRVRKDLVNLRKRGAAQDAV
jgi:lipid II:glycine glycyltransferase (peptidoglycan interpeptide bridge formation enzyme)